MMDNYQQIFKEETAYLKQTLDFIRNQLDEKTGYLQKKKKKLISSRKDMWENTAHSSRDFAKLTEVNQHLSEVTTQTASYVNMQKHIDKYRHALDSPYFGRFDFIENNSDGKEKFYIGLCNIMNQDTHDIYVYDWRAPVSSIYYQYQLGKASYSAPIGVIEGEILLKRQYKIQHSQLKYFFDSSIRINDEMLQEVLSRSSSPKMRNIVETIQREQDMIIRDTDNELLIVQGAAGSGKTSVALHRIAFLLYEGMGSNIRSNNIIILSPNSIFSKYISSVLPELGEENVEEATFEEIAQKLLQDRAGVETRGMRLESLIMSRNTESQGIRMQSIEFKGSNAFVKILNRLLQYWERNMIEFKDVYYGGKIIETKELLKNSFLNNKIGTPMAKRLKRTESILLEKIHPLQRKRLERIEKIVQKRPEHEFEIKPFSRLLSIKKDRKFVELIHSFTQIDYLLLYKTLFSDNSLFYRLSQGIDLPENIEQIIANTKESLNGACLDYEDCAPVLYLKLRIEGVDMFSEKRQVVIDEAQDYHPLHYEIFKLLFQDARYTVLGDINQSIEKNSDLSFYDFITEILDKRKAVKLLMNKSYRSSYEINMFTQKLMSSSLEIVPFDRHEEEPAIICKDSKDEIDRSIALDISSYLNQGYDSIAVITKTQFEAGEIHERLSKLTNIKLINSTDYEIQKGALCIPSYLAKGLEFDVVIIYNADKESFCSAFDRKLLYISCTRPLHRLILYYTGEKSPFI